MFASLVQKFNFIEKIIQNSRQRGLLVFFSVDVIAKGLSFVLTFVYLRIMNQDDYGLYNYLVSIINLISSFLICGFNISQSKIYFDYTDSARQKSVIFSINITLLAGLLVILSLAYFTGFDIFFINSLIKKTIGYQQIRIIFLIAVISSVFYNMFYNYLVISNKLKQIQLYIIIRLLLTVVAPIFIILLSSENSVFTRIGSTYIFELGLLIFFYLINFTDFSSSFNKEVIIKSFKIGFPFILSMIPGLISTFIDKYFLEKYGSYSDLSIYYFALAIASIISMVSYSFNNIWSPEVYREKDLKVNLIKTNRIIRQFILVYIILSVLIFSGTYFAFITGIIKIEYWNTITILPFLLIAQIFLSFSTIYSIYVIYFEKTQLFFYINAVFLLPNLILNYIFIKLFNITGAAITNLIINIMLFACYYYIVKKLVK